MKKLFAVMLGGRAKGCHIELHDVVFVVSETLEQAYPKLVNKWFGQPKRVHIDSSVELSWVDGYEIRLTPNQPAAAQDKKLYFINFGAYRKDYFGEIHAINFYVATSVEEAVKRAKKELCLSLLERHCDDKLLVTDALAEQDILADDILEIAEVDQYYIDLQPSSQPSPLKVESYYRKLTQK